MLYSSPKKYEYATGKAFTEDCANIHKSGSIKGMKSFYLNGWNKEEHIVKHGNYYYNQDRRYYF